MKAMKPYVIDGKIHQTKKAFEQYEKESMVKKKTPSYS